MFTGLIEEIGTIKTVKPLGGGLRLTVSANKIMDDLKIDDSVALNGVCQTVVAHTKDTFDIEAVEETIRKTTFKSLRAGDKVNLERALKANDRLGGHIVQGHVDCVGRVQSIQKERTGVNVWINFPVEFGKYLVNTGSICVNGVSLTSAKVERDRFMVSIIPHTWDVTLFKEFKSGIDVNLEFDILGKYIEKIIQTEGRRESGNTLDRFMEQPDY